MSRKCIYLYNYILLYGGCFFSSQFHILLPSDVNVIYRHEDRKKYFSMKSDS